MFPFFSYFFIIKGERLPGYLISGLWRKQKINLLSYQKLKQSINITFFMKIKNLSRCRW